MADVTPVGAKNLLVRRALEPNTRVLFGLTVQRNDLVAGLPDGTECLQWFTCNDNPLFESVGSDVYIGESLSLIGCPKLSIIGRNLMVRGDLHLADCLRLATIGNGLDVGGRLNLSGCSLDIQLPREGRVGDTLILPNGFSRAAIPADFTFGKLCFLDYSYFPPDYASFQ